MKSPVFGNEFFDQWLHQKSVEILSKVEKEKMSTEDMLILSLKAQVNHFHHMDIEFREDFKTIGQNFTDISSKFNKIDQRFERLENSLDKRFDRLEKAFMWAFALLISSQFAIFLKLFT